jgi:hypothetical protein
VRALRSFPGILCAFLPLAACATAAGEDDRGRGAEQDGGSKPELSDAGTPDAFVIGDRPDAAEIEVSDTAAVDAGCAAETVDLLVNGDFDRGPGEPWVESSSGGFPLILPEGHPDLPFEVQPDSGTFLVYLGGYDDAADTILQELTLPLEGIAFRLRGAGRIDTDETQDQPFDHLFLELTSTAGEVVEELAHLTNEDATGQFIPIDKPVAGRFAGRTVRVQLRATTDVSLFTHFFFDTLRLEVTTCAGDAGPDS